jgi:hypothetical protein
MNDLKRALEKKKELLKDKELDDPIALRDVYPCGIKRG